MPDVVMPRLSDTMQEGVLSRWLKAEGDQVHRGDVIAEIETDKATMDLEAYDEGVLERLLVPEGTTASIGTPLAIIGTGAGAAQEPPPVPATLPRPPASTPPAAPETSTAQLADGPRVRTSPLARRIARDHGLDVTTVTGTGPGGRIVRADVEAAIAAAEATPETPRPTAASASVAAASADADVEEVPLTAVRRVTAQRLTESAAAPHFSLTSVVDAGRLLAFRAEINDRLADTGTKISVTDLLVRACAVTLRAHPRVNSSWGGDKILRHRRIHVGVAVAVADGLIVPVIRDTDRKSLGEIAAEAHVLVERARAGRLAPDEFRGGTFTISNLGMYGIDHFTAVINPPEAAILAVGAAAEEPVLRDGQVSARTTIKLTLSIDHRVLDGATAAEFLRDLRATLEEPLRIVI
ncbi:MAG TPA: dihydrolipoamide acetyltransferase family protein [Streptosporangiaceae bacterium]